MALLDTFTLFQILYCARSRVRCDVNAAVARYIIPTSGYTLCYLRSDNPIVYSLTITAVSLEVFVRMSRSCSSCRHRRQTLHGRRRMLWHVQRVLSFTKRLRSILVIVTNRLICSKNRNRKYTVFYNGRQYAAGKISCHTLKSCD